MMTIGSPIRRFAFSVAAACVLASSPTIPAWAIGSTPVTVVNPPTNPANAANVDEPGRIPYQKTITGNCAGQSGCEFDFPFVPAGDRLVLREVGIFAEVGQGSATASNTQIFAQILNGANLGIVVLPVFQGTGQVSFSGISQSVLYYADANQNFVIKLNLLPDGGSTFLSSVQVTLSGYLVNCAIASCAAIAP